MSLDFSKVPPEHFAFNRKVLALMENSKDEGDTMIQYQGGFTLLHAYEEWQKRGRGELIVFKTQLGCRLAQFVETWLNVNASSAMEAYGRESDEFERALNQLRFMGTVACQALASESAAQAYQGWKANNRNTPADITEDELRLAYAAEVLAFALELWQIQVDGNVKRTLH